MNPEENKRREPRIKQPLVVRFRQLVPETDNPVWDVATALNVSKSGICFNTMRQFLSGAQLEVKISNPLLEKESSYRCKVLRSDPSLKLKMFFQTVLIIEEADEQARQAFHQLIEWHLQSENN